MSDLVVSAFGFFASYISLFLFPLGVALALLIYRSVQSII
jgi:uncharacterized membrane protein